MLEISRQHPRYGYRRIWSILRRRGFIVNKKRVYRLSGNLGLALKAKKRRKRGAKGTVPMSSERPNHVWTYDFVQDTTSDHRTIRILNVVDEFSRICLRSEVARSMKSNKIISVLAELFERFGAPEYLRSDNGPEFIAKALKEWLSKSDVKTHYIEPGSPWQNAYCESFNGKLRDECLQMEIFGSLFESQIVLERWRRYYNEERPHQSLGYLTPQEYLAKYEAERELTHIELPVACEVTQCCITARY